MQTLQSRHLFDLTMQTSPPLELGACPAGERRLITVPSGTFSGERIRGNVSPLGSSDLLIRRSDGSLQLDVRLILLTEDGANILMTYRGLRRGEDYLRTVPFFETSSAEYSWLNTIICVAVGERKPESVRYGVFEIM